MSDLIRRGEALKALLKVPCKIDSDNYTWIRLSDAFGTIDEDVPSAEPEPKWIPVTEALPKGKEMVLITNNKGHVRCGQYQGTFEDKNYRWWWKHNTLEEVIAWMPLIEPYGGE